MALRPHRHFRHAAVNKWFSLPHRRQEMPGRYRLPLVQPGRPSAITAPIRLKSFDLLSWHVACGGSCRRQPQDHGTDGKLDPRRTLPPGHASATAGRGRQQPRQHEHHGLQGRADDVRRVPDAGAGRRRTRSITSIAFVRDVATMRDPSVGDLEQTEGDLDVAIAGEGYLVVSTPTGERYTRDGHLRLDDAGQLVTDHGLPVLTPGRHAGAVRAGGQSDQHRPRRHHLDRLRHPGGGFRWCGLPSPSGCRRSRPV